MQIPIKATLSPQTSARLECGQSAAELQFQFQFGASDAAPELAASLRAVPLPPVRHTRRWGTHTHRRESGKPRGVVVDLSAGIVCSWAPSWTTRRWPERSFFFLRCSGGQFAISGQPPQTTSCQPAMVWCAKERAVKKTTTRPARRVKSKERCLETSLDTKKKKSAEQVQCPAGSLVLLLLVAVCRQLIRLCSIFISRDCLLFLRSSSCFSGGKVSTHTLCAVLNRHALLSVRTQSTAKRRAAKVGRPQKFASFPADELAAQATSSFPSSFLI